MHLRFPLIWSYRLWDLRLKQLKPYWIIWMICERCFCCWKECFMFMRTWHTWDFCIASRLLWAQRPPYRQRVTAALVGVENWWILGLLRTSLFDPFCFSEFGITYLSILFFHGSCWVKIGFLDCSNLLTHLEIQRNLLFLKNRRWARVSQERLLLFILPGVGRCRIIWWRLAANHLGQTDRISWCAECDPQIQYLPGLFGLVVQ